MKILFVTDDYPVPPKDGRYIPIYKLVKHFGNKGRVDLLILNDFENYEDLLNKVEKPLWLKNIFYVKVKKRNLFEALIREILTVESLYASYIVDYKKLTSFLSKEKYDVVWISPVSLLYIFKTLKNTYNNSIFCVGLNDSIYFSYIIQGISVLIGRVKFSVGYLLRLIRGPFLFFCERNMLKKVDIIHVQTYLERKRESRLFFFLKKKPKILVAPNGKKEELLDLSYTGYKYKRVLLMNHMDKNKKREGIWFVENIWPKIRYYIKEAELHIIGYPPDKELKRYLESFNGVKIRGFLENIKDCYRDMTVSVIYTFQNYGIVNRLLESMSAGLPVIISKGVYRTIEEFGFKDGVHGIVAFNKKLLIKNIVKLLKNEDLLKSFSENSKLYIRENFSWSYSLNKIEQEINKVK